MARSAQDIVRAEVIYCVSELVATLAAGYGLSHFQNGGSRNAPGASQGYAALDDVCEQALELAAPIADYESAAIEAGWKHHENSWRGFHNEKTGEVSPEFRDPTSPEGCAEALCRHYDIEPCDREVFEHWIVSDWLADELDAKGEKVDRDFSGMTVWARTTTGQAISMDSVIVEIAADLAREYGE
jgi:hypothetical protein